MEKNKTLDTRGDIIFVQSLCVTPYIYLAQLNVLVRYFHFRIYRFCPIIIYTLLCKGAISTLLIRNISGISTDFNRSRTQLIKSIEQFSIIIFCHTIKDFIDIMIQLCYPNSFLSISSHSLIPISSAYIFTIMCRTLVEILYLFNFYALHYMFALRNQTH